MVDLKRMQATKWDKEYRERGALWRKETGLSGINPPEGSHILELGCGNGKTLLPLIRFPINITAIDISPKAVELCEKLVSGKASAKGKAKCMVADVCELPFENDSFDIILCFHVLDHLLEADRAIAAAEIIRVLKPNGVLHFRGFSQGDMRDGKGEELEKNTFMRKNSIIYHYFSGEELHSLFPLNQESIKTESWCVKYGSKPFIRKEIHAKFKKPDRAFFQTSA